MYRSPTYAGQKSKSVFVEMSERSADTARLLQQAREAQPEEPPTQRRALARRAASQLDHLLQRLGKSVTQPRGEARGQVSSAGPRSG
jgi:acyl-CoA reductase-like NAD-dependent aldehyde dehydrogenase